MGVQDIDRHGTAGGDVLQVTFVPDRSAALCDLLPLVVQRVGVFLAPLEVHLPTEPSAEGGDFQFATNGDHNLAIDSAAMGMIPGRVHRLMDGGASMWRRGFGSMESCSFLRLP